MGAITVTPDGDIVASKVEELRKELLEQLKNDAEEVIIDLSGTKLVDSSGIGLIIAVHNELKQKSRKLQLTNVSADILKMFKIMRLDKHFEITQ